MINISKKLLSLILDEEIPDFKIDIDEGKNNIDSCIIISCWETTHREFEECYDINLDTLGRLCKQWVKEQGMTNFSSWIGDNEGHSRLMNAFNFHNFDGETELEAIIAATNWVAKEKDLL